MILDANLQLSNAQAVTSTAVSTNTVDIGAQAGGQRAPQYVIVAIDSTVTASGAATVSFQIVSSASANLSAPTVLADSGPIPKAELTAGRRPIAVKASLNDLKAGHHFIGLQYTIGTGPLTAGAFTAFLTDTDITALGAGLYPKNSNIY